MRNKRIQYLHEKRTTTTTNIRLPHNLELQKKEEEEEGEPSQLFVGIECGWLSICGMQWHQHGAHCTK